MDRAHQTATEAAQALWKFCHRPCSLCMGRRPGRTALRAKGAVGTNSRGALRHACGHIGEVPWRGEAWGRTFSSRRHLGVRRGRARDSTTDTPTITCARPNRRVGGCCGCRLQSRASCVTPSRRMRARTPGCLAWVRHRQSRDACRRRARACHVTECREFPVFPSPPCPASDPAGSALNEAESLCVRMPSTPRLPPLMLDSLRAHRVPDWWSMSSEGCQANQTIGLADPGSASQHPGTSDRLERCPACRGR